MIHLSDALEVGFLKLGYFRIPTLLYKFIMVGMIAISFKSLLIGKFHKESILVVVFRATLAEYPEILYTRYACQNIVSVCQEFFLLRLNLPDV